jgi:Spy/CpxP family protein refolding chaperone
MLNLLSTGALWWNTKEGPAGRQPRKGAGSTQILKDKLRLTKEQERTILKIREDFAQQEESLNQLIRSQRDSMNAVMFDAGTEVSSLKKIAWRVAGNEYRMELLRIEQAQKLKEICTEEQLKEFQHLIINIRDFFQPKKKNE